MITTLRDRLSATTDARALTRLGLGLTRVAGRYCMPGGLLVHVLPW